ncbi:MAG: hypothetical protein JWN92_1932, partial [Candidatus Acidoferrum typicum]|nr:hypothetical protein [Candidatus Acidoferrum typicum]
MSKRLSSKGLKRPSKISLRNVEAYVRKNARQILILALFALLV